MLNSGILVNGENTSNCEIENNAESDEIAIGEDNDEIINDDEDINKVEKDEIVDTTINGNNEENKDENEKEIVTMQEIRDDNKHIRKSERIRKQRYEIHPDDIGNNDDEKDKSYKR